MKKRFGIVTIIVIILTCFMIGISHADTSYHLFNGIYITLPSSFSLVSSESSSNIYTDGHITVAISKKTDYIYESSVVYDVFKKQGLSGVSYSSAHNVYYVRGTDYSGSSVLTLIGVYSGTSHKLIILGRNYGDTSSQNKIESIISSLCKHNCIQTTPVQPTCTNVGYEQEKCTICGFVAVTDEIPALGHTEVVIPGRAATEIEDGLTEGKKCSVCGEILVEQQVIPKLTIKEGLCLDDDGVYRLYKNGVLDFDTYGIVSYGGGRFFIANALITKQNGLISDGTNWYFVAQGQVADYTGLTLYDGQWFYVTNGVLDVNKSGIVEYDGGLFMIAAGRILSEANGLIQDPISGKWYFVSGGQVASSYRGLALYDDHWFYIWNGVFQSDAEGWVDYDGSTFYVKGGMVV